MVDNLPYREDSEPLGPDVDAASADSEIDFDDEREEDQLPLDVVEAAEADALLDDPEVLSEADEE